MITAPSYRRKADRLEWHFRIDCPKYPMANYVDSNPREEVPSTMVCHRCTRLRRESDKVVDTRTMVVPKGILERLFS